MGFAGSEKWKGGSVGFSLAYLRTSLATIDHTTGLPDVSNIDTGNGVRFNLGLKYPTGPAMWGLVLQNFPGFVWWKDYRRDILPVKLRIGNTWRASKSLYLSFDGEKRFLQGGLARLLLAV